LIAFVIFAMVGLKWDQSCNLRQAMEKEGTMSMELSCGQEPGYLMAKISGQWTAESAKQVLEAMRSEAVARSLIHILIDAREVEKPKSEMTRFDTGEYVAKVLGFPFKLAVVGKPEVYNRFGETVAVNRGACIKVFFQQEEALQWLLAGTGKPGPEDPRDIAPDPVETHAASAR